MPRRIDQLVGLGHRDEVPALCLRFTGGETSSAPPDVAAFAAVDARLLAEQDAGHDDGSALDDLRTASVVARLRVIVDDAARRGPPVFVTLRATPIPAITTPAAATVDAFRLADRVHGHFAWPATSSRPLARGALVLAACLPLMMPASAQAQAPASPPVSQQPESAPVAVAVEGPAPVSPTTSFAIDPVAKAMVGRESVVFAAGTQVRGLIIGADGDFVTLVDFDRDGKIALIPKPQITEVRAMLANQSTANLPTGVGRLVGGSILVGVGAPLMLSGLVFLGFSSSSALIIGLPQALPAAALLGIGIPMLVRGGRERRAYKAAQQGQLFGRLTPSFGRSRGGAWTGGLTLRF